MVDFDERQQVEGFARLLSQSGIFIGSSRGLGPDYRGPSGAGATREWWRPAPPDEPDLVWLTADVPAAVDTTFTFVGESADLPENLYPPNQATLYADDRRVLTFDLGQRSRCTWVEADWALEFIPKQVHTTLGVDHRQFGPGSDSGMYRLAAPASALKTGQPLRLKVVLEPLCSDAINFFAVRERSDALEVSPRTNAEQIEQLQQEVIRLKRVVGALSRRSYPELLEDRLPTEDVIIYTKGRDHVHSPDVLCLQNGDLLACWRDGSEHISNDGKIAMVRSTDGGRTWGDRQVLGEYPDTDQREWSLAQLRDGTILGNRWHSPYYDRHGRHFGKARAPMYPGRPAGIAIGRSSDNGHTWTWSERAVDPAPFKETFSSERIIEMDSGRLLMANYDPAGGAEDGYTVSVAYCSDDKGYTWRYLSTMADVPGVSLSEPVFIQARSGRLIAMMRNDTGAEYYQALSDDGGETWTPARQSSVPGHTTPCSLVQLPSGTVLCVYGSRLDPSGIYVVASHDEGETWDMAGRRIIRDDFPNRDCGYTSTVLVPDGRILTVYYYNMFHRFFIAGSFFRWE
jgi:sialidase-1